MTKKAQLPALTGLRFVAAMWVVSLHLSQIESDVRGVGRLAAGGIAGRIEDAVARGSAGVTLFFVLSGFILTYTYWDAQRQAPIDRWAFWRARFSRVYPVYALGLVVGLWPWLASVEWHRYAPLATTEKVVGVFGATVLLLQAWVPRMAHRWNSVGWSLSNEAFFYFAFVFVVAPLARLRSRTVLAVGGAAYAGAVALATLATTPAGAGHDLAGYVYYHPLVRAADFLIGMATGMLFLRARTNGRTPAWAARAVAASGVAIVGVALASALLPPVLVESSLLAPLFAVVIYGLAWGQGSVARVLSARPLVALGEASYALYILHLLLLRYAFGAAGAAFAGSWWFAALAVSAVVTVSLVVYRWYEEPMRRRLRGGTRASGAPAVVLDREPPAVTASAA